MAEVTMAEPVGRRQHLPHRLDGGIAARAAIGLIVLATDQTIEHEFRRLLDLPGVALYESRILNDARITPETLAAMEARLVEAAGLILPGLPLDVVAFGCTSASMVIGEERVFERLREARPGIACTTPITAALAAFHALGVRRLALLTPYRDDINRFMRDYIEARGVAVPVLGSFNEEDDRRAARDRCRLGPRRRDRPRPLGPGRCGLRLMHQPAPARRDRRDRG